MTDRCADDGDGDDDSSRPMTTHRATATRRATLAAVGIGALSGCSTLGDLTGGGTTTIDTYDLREIDRHEEPESPVSESIPVEIDPSYFRASRERVDTLLSEVPIPLGPDEIPNGYVRQELTDAAADAANRVEGARTARTDFGALERLARARASARFAATGWAVADGGVEETALRDAHRASVVDARRERGEYEYVADDLVRAVAVHSRIESRLEAAATSHFDERGETGLLQFAEWGETAEEARTNLADARHLDTQFRRSLPENPETVGDQFERTAQNLFERARSAESDLGPEPTAEEWGVRERVIDDLRQRTVDSRDRVDDAAGPASAITRALDWLLRYRALDWATDRIDADEIGSAKSADHLASVREQSYDAVATTLAENPAPPLARELLREAGWRVVAGDREVAQAEGTVAAERLDDAMADYYVAWALARSVPETCRVAVETLRSA